MLLYAYLMTLDMIKYVDVYSVQCIISIREEHWFMFMSPSSDLLLLSSVHNSHYTILKIIISLKIITNNNKIIRLSQKWSIVLNNWKLSSNTTGQFMHIVVFPIQKYYNWY